MLEEQHSGSESNAESISLEVLRKLAVVAEKESHHPPGRYVDGSPYACYDTKGSAVGLLLRAAEKYFGGYEMLQDMVRERHRRGEVQADPDCGNWILWTLFLKLGIKCENP